MTSTVSPNTYDTAQPDDGLWRFADPTWVDHISLLGYVVAGTDTRIGKVVGVVNEPGRARLEIAIQRWPATGQRTIPAGIIAEVDHGARMVMLNLRRRQIERAPTFMVGPADPPGDLTLYYRPHLPRSDHLQQHPA